MLKLSIITEPDAKEGVMRITTHPGEVLREEFLVPLAMSARQLAEKIDVPANRLTDIIRGRRGISADTAQRLAVYFDTTPAFWMNLQANHDLSMAARENDYSRIKPRSGAAA